MTLHPSTLREDEDCGNDKSSVASMMLDPPPFSEYELYENFCSSVAGKRMSKQHPSPALRATSPRKRGEAR